ncbi:hypothetical protein SDC9_118880 [bioreactor metagenome]|uniref:Uncharacterized protein n=1 Tax=bioreactor metagenome TaxID=1076179 RepID=A0A645C2R1_9ZZZZ
MGKHSKELGTLVFLWDFISKYYGSYSERLNLRELF